jgi:hypothetical protein
MKMHGLTNPKFHIRSDNAVDSINNSLVCVRLETFAAFVLTEMFSGYMVGASWLDQNPKFLSLVPLW